MQCMIADEPGNGNALPGNRQEAIQGRFRFMSLRGANVIERTDACAKRQAADLPR